MKTEWPFRSVQNERSANFRMRVQVGRNLHILIDCDAVEKTFTENMYQRSQLDYLIYNDPIGYAKLVWEECPEEYLKTATDYTRLSDQR